MVAYFTSSRLMCCNLRVALIPSIRVFKANVVAAERFIEESNKEVKAIIAGKKNILVLVKTDMGLC